MEETFVRLLCPECGKDWQDDPTEMDGHRNQFSCPNCHATRRLAEFMRTEHDLETLKQFS